MIDKAAFNEKQWNLLFIDRFYDPNDAVSRQILSGCSERFRMADCASAEFQTFGKFRRFKKENDRLVKFGLYYDVFNFVQEPSKHKLFLDLVNIESILFDFNFLQFIGFLFLRLKIDLRSNKLCSFPFLLLSLAGFAYHLLFILESIQIGELLYGQYAEEPNRVEMPEIFLCFDSISSTDRKLTGNDLEELTKDIKPESVFRRVSYLDDQNRWRTMNFVANKSTSLNWTEDVLKDSPNQTDQDDLLKESNEFSIQTVYFFGKKCFKIRHQIDYSIGQFYFAEDFDERTQSVLKIDFNRSFVQRNAVTFFTKPRDKLQDLSALVRLDYSRPNRSHLIKQHSTEMTYRNKFNVIKNFFMVGGSFLSQADEYLNKMRRRFWVEEKSNPINLLKNALPIFDRQADDVDGYLSRLKNNFMRDCNATTLHLPLERVEFDLTINDSAFEEYYERVQRPKDRNSPDSLIYTKRTPINLLKEVDSRMGQEGDRRMGQRRTGSQMGGDQRAASEKADKADLLSDFVFNIMFYKESEVIRGNDESWSRLTLNLLNLFAIWMNWKSFKRLPLSSRIAKLKSRFKRKAGDLKVSKANRLISSRSLSNLTGDSTDTIETSVKGTPYDCNSISFQTDYPVQSSGMPDEAICIEKEEDYNEIRKEVHSTELSISRLNTDHF